MAREIAEEYASSLADLTVNSKPLINMLTILAEENVEHAGVIVETVEKHLEKVNADIKLPVLYLVDSIIKNVGGAYTTKFSQSIINMFTRTFKQVDEKTRSQMFKLRETWHDVFPATKLYQLDVKVHLIDPAWPIQAQPQANIHVNPNFVKKPMATTSAAAPTLGEEEQMRLALAKKEQELLMLQRKTIELELEQTRKQLELAEKNAKKPLSVLPPVATAPPPPVPAAVPAPVVTPALAAVAAPLPAEVAALPVKQRLGPPVNSKPASTARIAPVSGAMLAAARRDPRLARHQHQPPNLAPTHAHVGPNPPHAIAPNVFDIKPLERVTKRKNVITIDVRPDDAKLREGWARDRDPRFKKKDFDERRKGERERKNSDRRKLAEKRAKQEERKKEEAETIDTNNFDIDAAVSPTKTPKNTVDDYLSRLADPKKINKLPPIPKLSRNDDSKDKKEVPSPVKRRKDAAKERKPKKRDGKDISESVTSPEKKTRARRTKKEQTLEVDKEDEEVVAFKELKNYHKEHYMRRNKEKSESPEKPPTQPAVSEPTNIPDVVVENKDVDLRVLHPIVTEAKAAQIGQKRPSTEAIEGKNKKSKTVFDRLFGAEDVDLRQLPQLEDTPPTDTPASPKAVASPQPSPKAVASPQSSPKQKDWQEVKDGKEESSKGPSKLDLVRAKLAEATKGKDRLGRPLLFTKSPSLERERRRTISSEDTDLRPETDDEVNKETISLILSQAKEHFKDGKMDKNQYNTLMYQVMQLNEKLKLKEAKQRESLEMSKKKLRAQRELANKLHLSPNEHNRYGDIDERITPALLDTPPNSQDIRDGIQDSDMRIGPQIDGPKVMIQPQHPLPMPPMFMGQYPPMWRGMRPRGDDFGGPRRPRAAMSYYRPKFDKRVPRPFDPRFGIGPPIPTKVGVCQGESPVLPYQRSASPPPLGTPAQTIPPTDFRVIEYIDQDPMKTIEIDGVPREIRFYGRTAVIMLDWDDPREIKFLPGARRITFDNKDSVVLSFNEDYKQIEIDDQVLDIRFGAPTRELYIKGRWYECFFGAPPTALMIDGKPRMIKLDGPPPQVDIGKVKRTDLVAGKINMIIDAQQMCPVFLDSKVQKFLINGQFYTIRFVDSLKTVLINDVPFQVEFGGLPKPIFIGPQKHFIRFSVLPRYVRPGLIEIANMEGKVPEPQLPGVLNEVNENNVNQAMETDQPEELPRPDKVFSPDGESNQGGLDMLASLMPSSMAPASSFSGYSLAEPLLTKTEGIPGLEPTPEETKPPQVTTIPLLGNISVTDLFAKLVATGIVQTTAAKEDAKEDKEEVKAKPKEDKTIVHPVNLLRPETLRVKQPAIVSALYGGMQCSGCGARFPPEHTVRYSQHLDWHFRQNRRERDSARRAHSRHWHYDLEDWVQYEEVEDLEERVQRCPPEHTVRYSQHLDWHFRQNRRERDSARRAHSRHWHYDLENWVQYEEVEDLEEREKSWFETGGAEGEGEGLPDPPEEAPSVAAPAPQDHHCELCGDKFNQFYNEDKEEWHLRKAVQHEDKFYHPLCYEDYKAALAKEALPIDDSVIELPPEKAEPAGGAEAEAEEPIEIRDETNSQSDNDDVVEVLDNEPRKEETQEALEVEDEGDEDDVIYKAEPVVEVVVDDDADTDDETAAERRARDTRADRDFANVRIKQEPVDPDDEPVITAEEEAIRAKPDTSKIQVMSSIDGNVQLETAPAPAPIPTIGIRINITKTIPTLITQPEERMLEDISVEDEPPPPGEEPELEYKVKPSLEGVQFSRQPPVQKGSELSGLCSIM